MTAEDIQEFDAYLRACTNRQVQGVYEVELQAGRDAYVALTQVEAQRRGITLEAVR